MSDYRPPLRDIRFVLDHVVGVDELTKLQAFSHVDREVIDSVLDEAGRLMAEVVAPTNRVGDEIGAVHHDDGTVTMPEPLKEAFATYVTSGWNAVSAPAAYGGHGFPEVVGLAVQEMLTSANMALSLCPMLTHSAVSAIYRHGDDEQKATWLEPLISGQWTGTMLLTEPEAGSDVGALRAKAEPADDGTWRIFGTKIFITFGEHDMTENIIHLVLARAPDSPPGTKGISLFIVPKLLLDESGAPTVRNDVTCVSIEHKPGIHASPTCVMSFGDGGDGAVGYLLGEVNHGMRAMFTMMNKARLEVGLEGLAVSERSFQQALAYANERRQGRAVGAPTGKSSPIIEHPDVRRMLMTMKANIEAMRALMYDNAAAIDRAHNAEGPDERSDADARATLLTPLSKAWGTDLGVEMTSLGVQIHGGMGYVEETGSAQHWRDSRIAPIYEGTNGIQAIHLALRVLPMDGGAVVGAYLEEITAAASEAEADTELASLGAGLRAAVAGLRDATQWMLDTDDTNDVLAGASPYLRAFGVVAGGYYLVKEALAARRLASPGTNGFLDAKTDTARFYVSQILPQAAAQYSAVTAGADQLFAVDPPTLEA
jgi:alkylation response protein AidB-like acyl-CoA dehydrogenase